MEWRSQRAVAQGHGVAWTRSALRRNRTDERHACASVAFSHQCHGNGINVLNHREASVKNRAVKRRNRRCTTLAQLLRVRFPPTATSNRWRHFRAISSSCSESSTKSRNYRKEIFQQKTQSCYTRYKSRSIDAYGSKRTVDHWRKHPLTPSSTWFASPSVFPGYLIRVCSSAISVRCVFTADRSRAVTWKECASWRLNVAGKVLVLREWPCLIAPSVVPVIMPKLWSEGFVFLICMRADDKT